jgi:hypothetical protein
MANDRKCASEDCSRVVWVEGESLCGGCRVSTKLADTRQGDGACAKVVGAKHDAGKLRWSLLPLDATREVVRVLTKGAEKYTPNNWEYVENARERYYDALLRHVTSWYEGEHSDPEWGLHHLAHAACCALFLLALSLRGKIDAEPPA